MTGVRILYIINSMEGGGAASPLPAILDTLERAGASVRLVALTRRNGHAIPAIESAGYNVGVRSGGERDHLAALNWTIDQALDFEATHLWTSLTRATLIGQIAGQKLSLPVVSWQHNAFLKPWNERLLRWRATRSALWVANSDQVADLTRERLCIAESDLVTWPIFFADPEAAQSRSWSPGETLRIGSLGRLHPAKGYDLLLAALSQLQTEGFIAPVRLAIAIAGEGDELARLCAMRDQAGLDFVEFSGFCDDTRQFLSGLHLYLQPSRREGFCIAAHEAMQAGLPVLVTATGAMPHTVVDGDMGRVVAVGEVEALADALRDMLTDPGALSSMGATARARVLSRFSREKFDAIGSAIVKRLAVLA